MAVSLRHTNAVKCGTNTKSVMFYHLFIVKYIPYELNIVHDMGVRHTSQQENVLLTLIKNWS